MEIVDMGEYMRTKDALAEQEDRYDRLAEKYLRATRDLKEARHALACAMDLARFYRSEARKNLDA